MAVGKVFGKSVAVNSAMNQVLCSTGALIGRPNNRNYRLLETLAERLDCDGFEFMMYDSWYEEAEEIVDYLRRIGLNIPVVHCEKRIGESISIGGEENLESALRLFRINCQMTREIGASKLVVHLWDGITSDRNIENNISAYRELAQIAGQQGLELLVENVVCNHEDPMKHWSSLRKVYPDIHFVFDTKMAAFHQQLELLYDEEYAWLWQEKYIVHYHVNDYAGGYMDWKNLKTLPLGQGNIDFGRFFRFVKETGYQGTFTVEATAFDSAGEVDTGMLNVCFDSIRRYLGM